MLNTEESQDLRPFAVVEEKGFTNVAQELLDIGAKYGGNVQVEDLLPCGRTVSHHVGQYEKIKLAMEELRQDTKLMVTRFAPASGNSSRLHFHYQLSEHRSASWDTTLGDDSLFLEIPAGPLVEGSKEGFTALLEFAEEKLKVNYVFVWFHKSREDLTSIIRTFHYMGFEMVKPGSPMVPARPDLAFMVYSLDHSSSDEE